MSTKRGSTKWQHATTSRRKKRPGEWVDNGDLYRAIAAGYNYFLAQRIRSSTLAQQRPL